MTGIHLDYRSPPSAAAFMARAILAPSRRQPVDHDLQISATWDGHRVAGEELRSLTGLAGNPYWRLLYPLVIGFRLQMVLLTHPAFPFAIWRALQIRNHLELLKPFDDGALLSLHTRVEASRLLDKGTEIDLRSTASIAGEPVWESTNTFYYRGRQVARDAPSPRAAAPAIEGEVGARWRAPTGARTRFGGLTGDYNGIHLWDGYARRFGFRGAFLHPQRALGQCLARLRPPDPLAPLRLDAWLKGQVYYGAEVALRIAATQGGLAFALHVDDDERPAIVGQAAA